MSCDDATLGLIAIAESALPDVDGYSSFAIRLLLCLKQACTPQHLVGTIVYGAMAKKAMEKDARLIETVCSDWDGIDSVYSIGFRSLVAITHRNGAIDATNLQSEWVRKLSQLRPWNVLTHLDVITEGVALVVKHRLLRADDIPHGVLGSCRIDVTAVVPLPLPAPSPTNLGKGKRKRAALGALLSKQTVGQGADHNKRSKKPPPRKQLVGVTKKPSQPLAQQRASTSGADRVHSRSLSLILCVLCHIVGVSLVGVHTFRQTIIFSNSPLTHMLAM